jgi:hypothetical protein
MARRKFKRVIMEYIKDQLVDEYLEEKMVAVAQRGDIAAIRWQSQTRNGEPYWLRTPYGELEIWCGFRGCWKVERDGAPLVHARSPHEALFTSIPAAKAAGLVHLPDGFGNDAPYNDGLWWNIKRSTPEQPVRQAPSEFPVDPTISDDHEWGRQRLDSLLKESTAKASASYEDWELDLEAVARSWQLRTPKWTKQAHGYYELKTPYGLLVVRRLIGWTVERNGAPLVWFLGDEKIIFDKLEHAKTSALVHARDYGDRHFPDGTRWDNPADNALAKCETPDQSNANRGK